MDWSGLAYWPNMLPFSPLLIGEFPGTRTIGYPGDIVLFLSVPS